MTLLHFVIVAVLLAAIATQEFPIAPLGCDDKCGNISIPYPFGLSDECYYDPQFSITCNTTYDPPRAFLTGSNIPVNHITLDGKLHILQVIASDCYNESGPTYKNEPSLFLTKFFISNTENIFVGIGCDTQAVIRGFQQDNSIGYRVGCISEFNSMEFVNNNNCSGIGCCQTSIGRLPNISIAVGSFQNHHGILDFNPCSYAFIVEEKLFNFTKSYLKNLRDVDRVPMVIEWTIGYDNCSSVRENMMYSACQANHSGCYDPINGPGYRCKCLEGYQGNPYLPDGCQDIDECIRSTLNDCEGTCLNIQGGYYCVCPRWHHGDGRKSGRVRIPLKLFLIVIVGCSSGLGIPFLLVIVWWLCKVVKRRKEIKTKKEFFERNGGLLLQQQISSGDSVKMATKLFTSKELESATDNYNENRILGLGGQGTVYKGMLQDGRIVAIKKSKVIDKNQLDQFINEVVVLQQINHRNVVKLLGCCLETKVPMLVYEFIPNGTLF